MSFKEVLGKYKYEGGRNRDLNYNLNLEATNVNYYENDLNYRVRGNEQFQREKENINDYRFYGRINCIVNLKLNREFSRIPSFSNFDPSNSNTFDLYITYPTSVNGEKGIKDLSQFFIGKNKLNINFNNGLPLFEADSKIINGKRKAGFLAFIGHNFDINDIIEINDLTFGIRGRYKIIFIENNYIYIESEPFGIESSIQSRSFYNLQNLDNNVTGKAITNSKQKSTIDLINEQSLTDVNISSLNILNSLSPQIYCKKVKKNRTSEYYIRTQRVIQRLKEIYNSGFSRNYYQQPINLFNQINSVNRKNYKDNLDRPLSSFYIGFIKHAGDADYKFSSVESNFSNLIDNTFINEGIEVLSERVPDGTAKTPNKNTILLESLVEYDEDDLREYEINNISHTFLANPDFLENQQIKFTYNPFYEVPIRVFSTYIESTTNKDLINLPDYSVFDSVYEKFRWRDLLDIGFFESNGNGINYPFLNGHHYRYLNLDFFIKNNNSPKYNYFDGSLISTEFSLNTDLFSSLEDSDENQEEVFQNYNKKC